MVSPQKYMAPESVGLIWNFPWGGLHTTCACEGDSVLRLSTASLLLA